jgi:hypothetical protein
MANTTPTPVSFFKAIHLVALLLLKPITFLELQAEDAQLLNSVQGSSKPQSAEVVRRALVGSFILVVGSAAVGYLGGIALGWGLRCISPGGIVWFQIIGTSLLLWGTLFVRGWDIQTYGGVSFTERVNQWIYRTLYCIGTATLVASLALPACRA